MRFLIIAAFATLGACATPQQQAARLAYANALGDCFYNGGRLTMSADMASCAKRPAGSRVIVGARYIPADKYIMPN